MPLAAAAVIGVVAIGIVQVMPETELLTPHEKLVAVPVPKVFAGYAHVRDIDQVSGHWLERIGHFFEHYKDLEKGKWVKLEGWGGADEAKAILLDAIQRFNDSPEPLNF